MKIVNSSPRIFNGLMHDLHILGQLQGATTPHLQQAVTALATKKNQ